MSNSASTVRSFAEHVASAPPSHDPRRDAFQTNGVSSIGGSAEELSARQMERIYALSTVLQCAHLDAADAVMTGKDAMIDSLNSQVIAQAWEAIAYMSAEAIFYRECAARDSATAQKAA